MPDWYEGDFYASGCGGESDVAYEIRKMRNELAHALHQSLEPEEVRIGRLNRNRAYWWKYAEEARTEAVDLRYQLDLMRKIPAPQFVWYRPWTIFQKWGHAHTLRELERRAMGREDSAQLYRYWSTIGAGCELPPA